jgi:hypothetical protein
MGMYSLQKSFEAETGHDQYCSLLPRFWGWESAPFSRWVCSAVVPEEIRNEIPLPTGTGQDLRGKLLLIMQFHGLDSYDKKIIKSTLCRLP